MVSFNQTIGIESNYNRGTVQHAGAVYIFNGSLRDWTQVQRLVLPESEVVKMIDLEKESHSMNYFIIE